MTEKPHTYTNQTSKASGTAAVLPFSSRIWQKPLLAVQNHSKVLAFQCHHANTAASSSVR